MISIPESEISPKSKYISPALTPHIHQNNQKQSIAISGDWWCNSIQRPQHMVVMACLIFSWMRGGLITSLDADKLVHTAKNSKDLMRCFVLAEAATKKRK
eukprot:485239_1